jgi:hypothetical protein
LLLKGAAQMLKLYGQARSRASRSLWMLEEIGIAYEHVPIRPYTESRQADYLRINPNGHIPSLDDGGYILWESLAINLYLAENYAAAIERRTAGSLRSRSRPIYRTKATKGRSINHEDQLLIPGDSRHRTADSGGGCARGFRHSQYLLHRC